MLVSSLLRRDESCHHENAVTLKPPPFSPRPPRTPSCIPTIAPPPTLRQIPTQLSAHQIATELGPGGRLGPPGWYEGGLLTLAYDLGKRLLPAFDTPLGIPVHRVNLRKGIPRGTKYDSAGGAINRYHVRVSLAANAIKCNRVRVS